MLTLNRFAYDPELKRRKKLTINVDYPLMLDCLYEQMEDNIMSNPAYIIYGSSIKIYLHKRIHPIL